METHWERIERQTAELFDSPIRTDKIIIMQDKKESKTERFHRELAEIPVEELFENARQQLSDICRNPRKFNMTSPPGKWDTDMIFGECFNRMKAYYEQLKSVEAVLFNTENELKELKEKEAARQQILKDHYSKRS
jgi:hypothetical protein